MLTLRRFKELLNCLVWGKSRNVWILKSVESVEYALSVDKNYVEQTPENSQEIPSLRVKIINKRKRNNPARNPCQPDVNVYPLAFIKQLILVCMSSPVCTSGLCCSSRRDHNDGSMTAGPVNIDATTCRDFKTASDNDGLLTLYTHTHTQASEQPRLLLVTLQLPLLL